MRHQRRRLPDTHRKERLWRETRSPEVTASPSRYPQLGKTVEGDEIARSQASHRQGCSPIPMGRKDHGGSDPMGGFEPTRCLAFLDTLRTIRHCCSRPLLRRGHQAPRIKGQIALVFKTLHGAVKQASPWAWALKCNLVPSV